MRPLHSPRYGRPSRVRALRACALGVLVLGVACHDFSLPVLNQSKGPVVSGFEPEAGFAWTELEISGANFDPEPENNAVLFGSGLTVRARHKGGDPKVPGSTTTLYVVIPEALQVEAPISVMTPVGTSAPSAKSFYPKGFGHPIYGTQIVDVRFRHKPAGLYDSPETVLIASTLFDQLVNDTGKFQRLEGRAVAFGRAPTLGEALVSVRQSDGTGILKVVDGRTGVTYARSEAASTFESLIVVSPAGQPIRTIGVDRYGLPVLNTWTRTPVPPNDAGEAEADLLTAEQTRLPDVKQVLGAAGDSAGNAYLVATTAKDDLVKTLLLEVDGKGEVSVRWEPNGSGEQDDVPQAPAGAIAVTETATKKWAALGIVDGDLMFVDLEDGSARHELLVSFGAVGAIAAGAKPGKVVLTKPADGSVLQYDAVGPSVDWAVQIRGEPTVIDVAPDIGDGEVAVGNNEDNGVDIIEEESGLWLGRISFGLGLGSADQGEGGLVAPYSYWPDQPPYVIQVLARLAGMVLELDSSSLDVVQTYELATEDPDTEKPYSPPLRLLVTPNLRTVVVHAKELGLLDRESASETILVKNLPAPPSQVTTMPDNTLVVGTPNSVTLYEWDETDEDSPTLVNAGHVMLPKESFLVGLAVWPHVANDPNSGLEILAVRSTGKGYVADFYDPKVLALGGAPRHFVALDPALGDFLGIARSFEGPVLSFGQSPCESAAMFSWHNIHAVTDPPQPADPDSCVHPYVAPFYMPSDLNTPTLVTTSPDGYYVAWMSERQGVHVVRLVEYDPYYLDWAEPWAYVYATYQLENQGSSLTFDPSGQWMYVAVPKLDLLSVFQ